MHANSLANLHRRFRVGNLHPADGLRPALWEMGAYIHVLNVHLLLDIQVHVPIDAAVGQEVRMLSEWRNIQAFPGVQNDTDAVAFTVFHVVGDINGKSSISAAMFVYRLIVDEHLGVVCGTFKGEKEGFAFPLIQDEQGTLVFAAHLALGFIEIVIGKLFACVRNSNRHGGIGFRILREFPLVVEIFSIVHYYASFQITI